MEHITVWKDFFGNENLIALGNNDDVFIVFPNQKDEEGDSRVAMIPLGTILEFADKIKSVPNETPTKT